MKKIDNLKVTRTSEGGNSIKITGMIIGAVFIVVLLAMYVFFQAVPTNTLTSNGVATISAVPDLVSINFNVETNGSSAKEAKDANSVVVDDVITALVKKGFNRDEIMTQNFNVYENYEWTRDKSVFKGWKASHQLIVKVSTEDSDKIGEAIDAGIDSGAALSYINFELSQELENQYKTEALKAATEDAKIKAEAIASGLGSKLGKAVSIMTSEFGYYPWIAYDTMASSEMAVKGAEVATTIRPTEQEISGRVSVIYRLG